MEDCAGSGVENFHARFGEWSGPDAVSGPGVGNLERSRSEGSLRFITVPDFVSAGPEVTVVSRVAATTGCDGVSFNRALRPNGAGLGPAVIVAFFEADIWGVDGDYAG